MRALRAIINHAADHPTINTVARRILRRYHTPDRDQFAQARALHAWVQGNIKWVPEKGDKFVHPIWTLYNGAGDCDCHVALLGALLESIRIPVKLYILRRGGRSIHVYLKVGLPGIRPRRWIPAETSLRKPFGWDPQTADPSELRNIM